MRRIPVATVDALWDRGGTVAAFLWEKGGVFNGDVGYYLAAVIVYVLMGAVCVYTLFLMALARVALAVLLAIGPLFIVLLLFDGTKRFFEAWVAQLANYALVGVLAVLVASLLMTVVEAYAVQTAAKGAAILTVDALDMLLVSGLVLLILRQVMPIAARLAGGVALASHGRDGSGRLRRSHRRCARHAAGRGLVLLISAQVMPIAARLSGGVALASQGVMGAAARVDSVLRGGGSYAGRSMLDRAAVGLRALAVGSAGSGTVTSLAPASAMSGKGDAGVAQRGEGRVSAMSMSDSARDGCADCAVSLHGGVRRARRLCGLGRAACRSAGAGRCRSIHSLPVRPRRAAHVGDVDAH